MSIVCLLVTGCTVGPEAHPQPFPGPMPSTAVTPTGSPGSPQTAEVTVYLVRDDRLSAATRRSHGGPDAVTTSLQTLAQPPSGAERSAGLDSALPADAGLLLWRKDGDGALVLLPDSFAALPLHEQLVAIGQLVYTVTETREVDQVSFALRGKTIDVPDGAGRLLARPVTRADYRTIAPR